MPNTPGTQPRQVRIPDDEWRDFATAAGAMDTDRASEIRAFIRWYLRRPGCRMPKRPDVPTDSRTDDVA